MKSRLLIKILVICLIMCFTQATCFANESITLNKNSIQNNAVNEESTMPAAPVKPEVKSVTSNKIVLVAIDGCEYSIDDGASWQASYIFDNLKPDTTYSIYQRYAETDSTPASAPSEKLVIKTKAVSSTEPEVPKVKSVEGNVITLESIDGYEYKYEGGEWQDSCIFTLDSFTTYEFTQRAKETDTIDVGEISNPIKIRTGRITVLPEGSVGIYTKADLNGIRNKPYSSDVYYILMNDIKFIDADFMADGNFYNGGKGWEPIPSFHGKFDGNGYSISGLKCEG
ncbi:MAG: fibronectin type III domain-containing protein, partial [Lachnospiraceae bacterium]|nr:fibronectin type III domain-containing protein [Lachnospiraceae bacterium]